MSEVDPIDDGSSYPRAQFAFFVGGGAQLVFRGDSVDDIDKLIDELLDAVDETDGPGFLSKLEALKAAGLIKEQFPARGGATAPAKNSSTSPVVQQGGFTLPAWLIAKAEEMGGTPESNISKKTNKRWFAVKVNDQLKFLDPPRNG